MENIAWTVFHIRRLCDSQSIYLGQLGFDGSPLLLQGFHLPLRGRNDLVCERGKQGLKTLVPVDRQHPVVFPRLFLGSGVVAV